MNLAHRPALLPAGWPKEGIMYYASTEDILAEIVEEMDIEAAEASGILDSLLEPIEAGDDDSADE
jgi:hypothetical protein